MIDPSIQASLIHTSFVQVCLSNIAIGAVLGFAGFLALRARRPAWAHAFCLLALLKLVTPALADVAFWTDQVVLSAAVVSELPIISDPMVESVERTALEPESIDELWPNKYLVFGIWGLGVIVSLLVTGRRIVRFHRWARKLREASVAVQSEVASFARRVGVNSIPRVLVTTDLVSPMLCPTPTGALLILPAQLLSVLDTAGRHAMIVHELAHLRRKDWLVRFLEIAVLALWWWLPLVYWLRRSLREAEELCCDAWVTSELPGRESSYAEALVATADLLAASSKKSPVHVMAMSPVRELEVRVRMMMKKQAKRSLGVWGRVAVLSLAAICLPFSGTVAQEFVRQDPKPKKHTYIEALKKTSLDIERESIDIYEFARIAEDSARVTFLLGPDVAALTVADRTIEHLKVEKMNLGELLDVFCRHTKLSWEAKPEGVVVIRARRDYVTCLGAFDKSGRFELKKELTLLELLSRVSAPRHADWSRVTVIRPDSNGPLQLAIDVEAMIRTGRTNYNITLRANDVVYVPSKGSEAAFEGVRKQGIKIQKQQSAAIAKPLINKDLVESDDLVSFLVDPALLRRPGMEQLGMLALPQRIGKSGTILVPFLGSLKVLGLKRKQVEEAVVSRLQVYFTMPVTMTARISSDR